MKRGIISKIQAGGLGRILALFLGVFLGAVAQPALAAEKAGQQGAPKKPLVIYYSQSGNTQKVAEEIHARIGGDILRVEPLKPYPADYDSLVAQAREEQKNNARPEIRVDMPDFDQYGIIFVGYPNWWSSMPMPMFTFLDKARLEGKTIAPFDTHGGGGLGHSVEDLKKLLGSRNRVLPPLAIAGSEAGTEKARAKVGQWLEGMGLAVK